jgi:hypothetical protein
MFVSTGSADELRQMAMRMNSSALKQEFTLTLRSFFTKTC